jgi:hypothetical protein
MQTKQVRCIAPVALLALAVAAPLAADHMTDIGYREVIERIVDEQDLNRDGWSHGIDWITESGDGLKVCFWTLASKTGQPNQRHFWICNADGSGLRDITPAWSTDESPRWPRLNHDGSRMFYVAFTHNVLRYIDTNTGQKVDAVPEANDLNYRKPYEINRTGTRAFFIDWDSSAQDCARYGVAYADIPGNPSFIYTMANLPFDDYCNKNRIALLGTSDTGRAAISWSTKDYGVDSSSMFIGGPEAPRRVPNEKIQYVYSLQDVPHRQMSRDGHRMLYHSGVKLPDGTTDNRFELIEPDTDQRHMLVEYGTNLSKVDRSCLSPCGNYVRFNDPRGAYATRMVLDANVNVVAIQDTLSYHHTPLVSPHTLSDMCDGGHRWFGYSSQDWGAKQKVYRFDLNYHQTGGSSGQCPIIQRVGWSRPMLLKDDSMKVAVYVTVSDPQGLGDIEWVRVLSLIDYGRETAVWDTKGRDPLSSGGDMGWALLTDDGPDGNQGDEVAGDGVYTFHGFWTRSYSDFWEHYASEGFPLQVPIRVFVKDKGDNYAIADTLLSVTNDPAQAEPGNDTDDGDTDDDGTSDDTDGDTDDDGTDGDGDDDGTNGDDDDDGSNGEPDGDDDGTADQGTGGDDTDGDGTASPGGAIGGLCPTSALVALLLIFTGLCWRQAGARRRS